jgi:NodT family efflux transporter outer membrane factor (OMF) lipoprotein
MVKLDETQHDHWPARNGVPAGIRALCLGVLTASAGCTVGPDFSPPTPPATQQITREPLPTQTEATDVAGGEAQRFQPGQDLPGQWWTLFGSSHLDTLIARALVRYPDIAAQQAALRTALASLRAGEGAYFPQVQGATNAYRENVSGLAIGPGYSGYLTNLFQATVSVSYNLDVFGGERRTVEGLRAQAEAQNFVLEASYLTLTSNLVAAVVQLAAAGEEINATGEIINSEQQQLRVIQRQFELGSRTRSEVLQQQSSLAAVRTTLPPLQQRLAAAQHQIAVLTGDLPADAPVPHFDLKELNLPRDLPVSLPSALVSQRPDIRAQSARLHQASAAIGVATANMLPQLTLTGNIGNESLAVRDLLQPGSGIWSVAAGISQPLFAGGALRARRRAAIASYEQARAQYQLVVLNAFQNVADSLTALENDAHELADAHDSLQAASASLDVITKQYDISAVDSVALLTAQQLHEQARITYIQALANRYIDTITLFQALGGGWWNRTDPGTLRSTSPSGQQ